MPRRRLRTPEERLENQGAALAAKIGTLRGAWPPSVAPTFACQSRLRARTENNCVARDIVRVGDLLVFGCNVFMGLRKDIHAADVFSLYRLNDAPGKGELEPVPLERQLSRRFPLRARFSRAVHLLQAGQA